MRISVVGTSGSGKSTLSRALARALDIPYVEIDAINWQPGWRDLATHDPDEFRRRVAVAIREPAWVIDGNYGGALGQMVRDRATHLVWLDYDRAIVMARVIRRSFLRALTGRELWPGTGNKERLTQWLHASHPIRWAWSTWALRRTRYEAMLADPSAAHLTVIRLRHPREVSVVVQRLKQAP